MSNTTLGIARMDISPSPSRSTLSPAGDILLFGSLGGCCSGPSLADLTQKRTHLCGTCPQGRQSSPSGVLHHRRRQLAAPQRKQAQGSGQAGTLGVSLMLPALARGCSFWLTHTHTSPSLPFTHTPGLQMVR